MSSSVIRIPEKGGAVVISGPSGVGKTTLIKEVERGSGIHFSFSVSATTRKIRPGETDGVQYFFLSRKKFMQYVRQGKFIEYAEVHGELYGTLLREVLAPINSNEQVLLDIDVKGHALLRQREALHNKIISIFLKPKSLKDLEQMLRDRKDGQTEDQIMARIAEASEEMARAHEYDFQFVCHRSEKGFDEECFSQVCEVLRSHIPVRR